MVALWEVAWIMVDFYIALFYLRTSVLSVFYDREQLFIKVLVRVLPHLEQLELVFQYLAELGAVHQKKGVKKHHIDLGIYFQSY